MANNPYDASPAPAAVDTAICWFRRDLRVDDNPALIAALESARQVVPVFVWAPEEEGQFQPGRCSRWWLKNTLVDFESQLAALGSRLVIKRSADTAKALHDLVTETGATALFFNHLYDPISLVRDHEVKQALSATGVLVRSFGADLWYEPWEVMDTAGQPYTCFKDFWDAIKSMPYPPPLPLPAPTCMPPCPAGVSSLAIRTLDWFFTPEQEASSDQLKFKWRPGAMGAVKKLEDFLRNQLHQFAHDRAKVDRDSTSQLSPWVHYGTVGVRYIYYRVQQKQSEWMAAGIDHSESCHDFLQQMAYREYSRYLSFHFPFIHERALLAHLRACPWRPDQYAFKAWKQGLTGYPLVDAGMRQLWSLGWIHNRLRVVCATFAVKNLLLPWQWGLKHYWDALLDADLESDALGWQYVSGGMSDAKPFSFRIELDKESKRFDPDGEYVRRWLPVLSGLPTKYIHEPWEAPPEVLAAADVELGFNYPRPIISVEESGKLLSHACEVLEMCSSKSSDTMVLQHPYRSASSPPPADADGRKRSNTGASTQSGAPSPHTSTLNQDHSQPLRFPVPRPIHANDGMLEDIYGREGGGMDEDNMEGSDASSEEGSSEMATSEEVVSNMVGLSHFVPTAMSGFVGKVGREQGQEATDDAHDLDEEIMSSCNPITHRPSSPHHPAPQPSTYPLPSPNLHLLGRTSQSSPTPPTHRRAPAGVHDSPAGDLNLISNTDIEFQNQHTLPTQKNELDRQGYQALAQGRTGGANTHDHGVSDACEGGYFTQGVHADCVLDCSHPHKKKRVGGEDLVLEPGSGELGGGGGEKVVDLLGSMDDDMDVLIDARGG